jgi:hypothetical protein
MSHEFGADGEMTLLIGGDADMRSGGGCGDISLPGVDDGDGGLPWPPTWPP